jgi:hypothetical protein
MATPAHDFAQSKGFLGPPGYRRHRPETTLLYRVRRESCHAEKLVTVEHGLLGRFEHRVEPAQDSHRQDHVAVLAADVEIAEDAVDDAPESWRCS